MKLNDIDNCKLVSVCVCTYRRPQLLNCLESIARLRIPDNFILELIVVDNCPENSATPIVESIVQTYSLPVKLLRCSVKNLSSVRNFALAAANGLYIAMVDDDQIVSDSWLEQHVQCIERYNADAVIGPVLNQYSDSCPDWLRKSDVIARIKPVTGRKLITGHSGNALIRRSALLKYGHSFNEKLGHTGGEDTEFFFQLHLSGAKIIGCSEAVATEIIDPSRESLAFLEYENRRIGQVFCLAIWPSLSPIQRVVALLKITGKLIIFGSGFIITYFLGKRFSTYSRLRWVCNLEKVRYLLNRHETITPYCQ